MPGVNDRNVEVDGERVDGGGGAETHTEGEEEEYMDAGQADGEEGPGIDRGPAGEGAAEVDEVKDDGGVEVEVVEADCERGATEAKLKRVAWVEGEAKGDGGVQVEGGEANGEGVMAGVGVGADRAEVV